MSEVLVLTDANLNSVLEGDRAALILVSNGEGLRGEFVTTFNKIAQENKKILFAKIDPSQNSDAAKKFDAGSKPVLIGWHKGTEVVRRSRPWGSDIPLAVEMLEKVITESTPVEERNEEALLNHQPDSIIEGKPVVVTDQTFQTEVIDYDKPVLIDFWAPWCGPCRMVAPVLDKLAKEFAGQIRIAKVNVDENPGLSQTFRIMSIPTLMMIKQRTVVFNQAGALPEPVIRDLIRQLIALEIPALEAEAQQEPLTE